ncbi:hypothetical protein B0H16DRAFT_1876907 [Mycena metata]|uniref:Fungal-type protein kinase domain-containing protein n=1 Tax=Mycena metata TaxID=1033252 RepID=A0AAD7KFB8_9AGAR|nr:hypothetical protein B0H16DRAFT_1876907 [Mycena metata]
MRYKATEPDSGVDPEAFHDIRGDFSKLGSSSRSEASKNISTELEECLFATGDDGTARVGLYQSGSAVREDIEKGLLYELQGKRFASSDLLEHALGSLVSIDQASRILKHFLQCRLLSVKAKGGKAAPSFDDACHLAAQCARSAADRAQPSPKDMYEWEWHSELPCGSERESLDFMNIVADAAYILGRVSGALDASAPKPCRLFSICPRPHHAMALPDAESGQDSRPDGFLIPISSLCHEKNAERIIDPPARKLQERLRPLYWPTSPPIPQSSAIQGPQDLEVDDRRAQLWQNEEFVAWVNQMKQINGLDTSWICWPSIDAAGECKMTDLPAAKAQVAIYMRLQRCTQPWRRFTLGFIATKRTFGLLRADPSGVEETDFRRDTSLGVLQVIRLCLALTTADERRMGKEEGFSLRMMKSPSSVSACKETKRGREHEIDGSESLDATPLKKMRPNASKSQPQTPLSFIPTPPYYQYPEVDTIKVEGHTFYVHGLAHDSGSLVGRCTRVFSVSEEMTEEAKEHFINRHRPQLVHLSEDKLRSLRFWDGRFALKFIFTDVKSEAYVEGLSDGAARAVPNLLLPDQTWKGGFVLQDIRGWGEPGFDDVRVSQTERQLLISLSPFKRTLDQFQNLAEVLQALLDVAKAVKNLKEVNLMHRDISPKNILLANDIIDSVICTDTARGVFVRRPHGPQTGGLLHDFDMAGRIRTPEPPEPRDPLAELLQREVSETAATVRTGTTPFMSLSVLTAYIPHNPLDDLQSIFYVLYLLFFTYDGSSLQYYPESPPTERIKWPESILSWTRFDSHPVNLYIAKDIFFNQRKSWKPAPFIATLLSHRLDFWRPREEGLAEIVTNLFQALWEPSLSQTQPGWQVQEDESTMDRFILALGTELASENTRAAGEVAAK